MVGGGGGFIGRALGLSFVGLGFRFLGLTCREVTGPLLGAILRIPFGAPLAPYFEELSMLPRNVESLARWSIDSLLWGLWSFGPGL